MEDAQAELDTASALRLSGAQFPELANRTLVPLASAGADDAIYRQGEDLAVRLPLRESAVPVCQTARRTAVAADLASNG
jgi:aminoglycoside phosphotransferase (APT) family kinase protein